MSRDKEKYKPNDRHILEKLRSLNEKQTEIM